MMMRTKYFIGVPWADMDADKDNEYLFITDVTKPVVDEHGNVLTVEALTSLEEDALTFYDLDSALEWCDTNKEDYTTEVVENGIGAFDWNNAVIIKNDNTIIPL